jgi:hypothetical protein
MNRRKIGHFDQPTPRTLSQRIELNTDSPVDSATAVEAMPTPSP